MIQLKILSSMQLTSMCWIWEDHMVCVASVSWSQVWVWEYIWIYLSLSSCSEFIISEVLKLWVPDFIYYSIRLWLSFLAILLQSFWFLHLLYSGDKFYDPVFWFFSWILLPEVNYLKQLQFLQCFPVYSSLALFFLCLFPCLPLVSVISICLLFDLISFNILQYFNFLPRLFGLHLDFVVFPVLLWQFLLVLLPPCLIVSISFNCVSFTTFLHSSTLSIYK